MINQNDDRVPAAPVAERHRQRLLRAEVIAVAEALARLRLTEPCCPGQVGLASADQPVPRRLRRLPDLGRPDGGQQPQHGQRLPAALALGLPDQLQQQGRQAYVGRRHLADHAEELEAAQLRAQLVTARLQQRLEGLQQAVQRLLR